MYKDVIYEFILECIPDGIEPYLLAVGAAIGAFINMVVGGFDDSIYALITLCIIDYVTGSIAAYKTGEWSSSTGFVGVAKKAVIFGIVAFCNLFDVAMGVHMLRQMAICAYALNEAGSILENISKAGWGYCVPQFLHKHLAKLKERSEQDGRDV